MSDNTVKITVEVDKDVWESMEVNIPWGFRKHLMQAVIQLICNAIKREGDIMMGAILSGHYSLRLDMDSLLKDYDQREENSAET